MSIHSLNNFIYKTFLVGSLAAVFVVNFNVAVADTVYQEPSLLTRMSQSLGAGQKNGDMGIVAANQGVVLEAFQVKVPVFPRGFVYPIEQLGNCNNAQECYVYCEDPKNIAVCATVSAQQGYMTQAQARKAVQLASFITAGYLPECTTMNSCVQLCANSNAQANCQRLALDLNNNSNVLGVQTNTDNFLGRSIFETCDSIYNCPGLNGGSNLNTAYNSVLANGGYLTNCGNGAECFEVCLQTSASQSSGCQQFLASVGGLDLSRLNALRTSSFLSGALLMPDYSPGNNSAYEVGGGEGLNFGSGSTASGAGGNQGTLFAPVEEVQVVDIESCLFKAQEPYQNLPSLTPSQYNSLNEQTKQCQERFVEVPDTAQITQQGKASAVSDVQNITQCLLSSKDFSLDLPACLSLGAY